MNLLTNFGENESNIAVSSDWQEDLRTQKYSDNKNVVIIVRIITITKWYLKLQDNT